MLRNYRQRQQIQTHHHNLCSVDCAHFIALQWIRADNEAFNSEGHNKPDTQEAADIADVDEDLTPAFTMDDEDPHIGEPCGKQLDKEG